jgi:hypothetical protein
MNDYLLAIIIGVSSSFIASFMFLYFLNTRRPKITISEQIAKSHNIDGNVEYQIKTINKTGRNIINIQAHLFLTTATKINDGTLEKNVEIQLKTNNLSEMTKFNSKDKTAKYVFRFICEENIEKDWNENSFLRFKISATDSLSGFTNVFSKDYKTIEKSIKEGKFEFGKSLKIK